MNRKPMYVALLVLCAAVMLAGLFLASFERKQVTEQVRASGAARTNPLLALELILRQLDVPVAALSTLDPAHLPLHEGDTLVLGDDAVRVGMDDARRLAAWVRDGGHLLLSSGADDEAARTPLFEQLAVLGREAGTHGCATLRDAKAAAKTKSGDVQLCGERFRLAVPAAAIEAAIGDASDGYLFARIRVGEGRVSLLAGLGVISRQALKQQEAQRFAWRLLAPNMGHGEVYLIHALDGISFPKLLLTRGWPALLALTLLLAAWMAMRSARLGPLMPAPALHRRALLEHVQAAGEFIYRRDGGRSLHALARDAVLARLRRRDPASAMLHGEALYERLAERNGLDAAQIAQAFQTPANAQAFRTSILTLARLRSRP